MGTLTGADALGWERLGPGSYSWQGRYTVERQENYTECEHPLCDQLHQRFFVQDGHGGAVHEVRYYYWVVWDELRQDYARGSDHYDKLSEAKAWAMEHLVAS